MVYPYFSIARSRRNELSGPVAIVDSNVLRRNAVARFVADTNSHVEQYERPSELRRFWPNLSLILLHDDGNAVSSVFDVMSERDCWIPMVGYAEQPELSRVVDVIRMGAADYLAWPFSNEKLAERIRCTADQRSELLVLQRRAHHARQLVEVLSRRQRQVLASLACGATNKTIARELRISPRTIEIHRANMMGKLGVKRLAEAVTIANYAGLLPDDEG